MKALVLKTATFTLKSNNKVAGGSAAFTTGASAHVSVNGVAAMLKGATVTLSGVTTTEGFTAGTGVGVFSTGSEHIKDMVGLLLDDATTDVQVVGTLNGSPGATITVTVSIADPGQSKAGEV